MKSLRRWLAIALILLLWGLSTGSLAAPAPPVISLTTAGLTATATWEPVAGAVGYTLYYAPSPYTGPETIGAIEVGGQTSYSAELWAGAAFHVAVKAYDSQGLAGYSNIESFSITSVPLRPATSAAELEAFIKQGLRQQVLAATSYRYLTMGDVTLEVVGATALPGAAGDISYSGTNLQVTGVDEADRVKTDGRVLYVAAQESAYGFAESSTRSIRVLTLNPDSAVAAEISRVSLARALPLEGLYLLEGEGASGDLLLSIGTTRDMYAVHALDWFVPWSWQERQTEVNLIDVTVPAVPRIVKNFRFDGQLVSSRRIDSRLYLVLRHNPSLDGYVLYPQTDQDIARNEALIESSTLADLLPHYRVDGESRGNLPYERSYLPDISAKSVTADIIVAVVLDLTDPDRAPSTITLAGPTEALYMSMQSLYLATTGEHYRPVTFAGEPVFYETTMTTDLHKFALTGEGLEYRGSGSVEGHLGWEQDKKSFRMGEVGDALGIVTSVGESWGGNETSKLTILKESAISSGALSEVAHLPNESRGESLGKAGERLYSARFLGDRLFLVTFRVTDPLYILNLSDLEDPFIEGALEIEGYSDYLHPVSERLLLGIGKDAVPDPSAPPEGRGAWYQGLKLSLFDVSDAAAPREIRSIVIGKRGTHSEVLADHHALAYVEAGGADASAARLAIPVELHEEAGPWLAPDSPWSHYGWTHTGLYLFEITGIDTATPDLHQAGKLIVGSGEAAGSGLYAEGERAVILNDSVYYLHKDDVWSAPWYDPGQPTGPQ